jgi:hypothetical protein
MGDQRDQMVNRGSNHSAHACELDAEQERPHRIRCSSLTERVKLDLRVEYFNVFNHPMFGSTGSQCNPNSLWGSPGGPAFSSFGNVCPGTSTTNIDGSGLFAGQNALEMELCCELCRPRAADGVQSTNHQTTKADSVTPRGLRNFALQAAFPLFLLTVPSFLKGRSLQEASE